MTILNKLVLCLLLAVYGTLSEKLRFPTQFVLQRSTCCCDALSAALGDKVVYVNESAYESSIASYYTQQEADLTPDCIVLPTNKDDVSRAVSTIFAENNVNGCSCDFAVRSGGHGLFAGFANIQSGVVIDLQQINHVTVLDDKSAVEIGPGNRWERVYSILDEQGIAIPGGRVSTVGVGGLITGGGISFFSPRYGWVCDAVESFEVVLASGEIINANAQSNSDLWRALKGASNNLGVVTSFRMQAFPQGKFYGGFLGLNTSSAEQQFQAFEEFANNPNYDPDAALITNAAWTSAAPDSWNTIHNVEYTGVVNTTADGTPEPPAVFQGLTSLPQLFNTLRISNLTDFTVEMGAGLPSGSHRDLFVTHTYKVSAAMLSAFYEIAQDIVQPLSSIPSTILSVAAQPLPSIMLGRAAATGGNVLGVGAGDGNLMVVLVTAIWPSAADDDLVSRQVRALWTRADARAEELGVGHPHLYLNYAAPWQRPLASYGAESVRFLRETSAKYDPTGLFQQHVPGGFKLDD